MHQARSGHSLAANAANSVGQIYVATMAGWIGADRTMILGGVLTLLFTALALWRIPALLTFRDDQVTTPVDDSYGDSCGSSKSAPEMKQGEESMEECGQEQQQLVEQPSNTHGKD